MTTMAKLWWGLMLAGGAIGCEGSTTAATTPTVQIEEKSSRPRRKRPEPSGALCNAVKADRSLDLANLSFGDVLVLKYSTNFDDHPQVAQKALDAGALSARPSVTDALYLSSQNGTAARVVVGVDATTMRELTRFLKAGRVPAATSANEIVISEADATALDASLGDTVTIALRDPLAAKPLSAHSAKVVGLFDVGTTLGGNENTVWMDYARLQDVHPDYDAKRATSVGITLPRWKSAEPWSKELAAELGSTFHVLTKEHLQENALRGRDELLELCKAAIPPPAEVVPLSNALATCDDADRWRNVTRALSYATLGHATVITAPAPEATLPALVPPSALTPGKASVAVIFEAAVFTDASVYSLELAGRASADLAALAPYVVDGDIDKVLPTGGIALPRAVAQAIGVGVGHRLQLAARPPTYDPKAKPASLQVSSVEVAALLAYPAEALSLLRSSAFIRREFAPRLHADIEDGQANALIVWGDEQDRGSRLSFALAGKLPANAAVIENTTDADEATNRLVDATRELACPSP